MCVYQVNTNQCNIEVVTIYSYYYVWSEVQGMCSCNLYKGILHNIFLNVSAADFFKLTKYITIVMMMHAIMKMVAILMKGIQTRKGKVPGNMGVDRCHITSLGPKVHNNYNTYGFLI